MPGKTPKQDSAIQQVLTQILQRLDQLDHNVAEGFKGVDKRFEQADQRITQVDQRITQVEEQIRSDLKNEIRGVLKMLPEIGDDLLKRITAVHKAFGDFRDVSLMTWAEIKRHLIREDEEHEKIKQDAREFQAKAENLQQKSEAHELRITKLEAAQNTAA